MTHSGFEPTVPFDDLPTLPLQQHQYETTELLKLEARARGDVGELKGLAVVIPNQSILVNAVVAREAKDSSEIENIVTTQDEVYRALTLPSVERANPRAREVVRYREALWYGFGQIRKRRLLSLADIAEIQRIVVQNDAGFRNLPGTALVNDRTGETTYTPPQDPRVIQKLLKNLTEYLNNDDDSLTKSAILHYQFESIHPFYDGNGRTGRIINAIYLVMRGHLELPTLYLSSFILGRKADYYRLLLAVTKDGAWQPWIRFYLEGVRETAERACSLVRGIKALMEEQSRLLQARVPRIFSGALVEVLFEHPYCKSAFIERALHVERKTASRYLHAVAGAGLLQLRKIGRENLYVNADYLKLLRK